MSRISVIDKQPLRVGLLHIIFHSLGEGTVCEIYCGQATSGPTVCAALATLQVS
jgi:hypothetical protein